MTMTGVLVGTGVDQPVNLGWRPNLVICKTETGANSAIWAADLANWHRRSDALVAEASTGDGITITDTGFTVGVNARCNANGVNVHWFAFCDNSSGNLVQSSYQGSAQAGRKVRVFEGLPLQAMMVKRDAPPAPVWAFAGEPGAFYYSAGTGMVASVGTSLDGAGVLTVGAGDEVNQWAGVLGEGHAALGFVDRGAVLAYAYSGNAVAGRRLFLPWEPEAFIIVPLDATTGSTAAGRMWMSTLLGSANHMLLSNGANAGGVLSGVVDQTIALTADASVNAAGKRYGLVAFRRCRRSATHVDPLFAPTVHRKSIQLDTGAYIDCGVDDSLRIQGPRTLEWYGALYTPSTARLAGGAGVNDEGNKQVPIVFRSDGADDTDGAVSYGIELCTPQAYSASDGGYWTGSSILVATHDRWTLSTGVGGSLDNHPMNTGFVVDQRKSVHLVVIEDGEGGFWVLVNGVVVKERRRSMAAIGRQDARAYSGHRLIFGARKRGGAPAFAYGQQFRLARIFGRALGLAEGRGLFAAVQGRGPRPTDFVEEWDAANAFGTTLPATRRYENNGAIVGTAVIQG
jgi:hypothetical protein